MLLSISHTTSYQFSESVAYGLQRLRLTPKTTHGQEIVDWSMALEGVQFEAEYEDQHHNHTTLVSVTPGTQHVKVACTGSVNTADNAGMIGQHAGHMPLWCFLRKTALTEPGPNIKALLANVDADREKPLEFLHALSSTVREAVSYETGMTDVETTAEEALTAGHGVCQDHAHIFISAGRLLDIPMRYAGGYLLIEGREEQDAGHGWAEAHVDGLGWIGFDISNGIGPDERYVRVATGCDYSEAAPVKGIAHGAGESELQVHLSVVQEPVGQQQQ
jgi:transglutaminase-like putative cysteine protease